MALQPVGSGSLDVGIFADSERAGGRLGYAHHVRDDLALYAEGWGAYGYSERKLGYGVLAGMRWRW